MERGQDIAVWFDREIMAFDEKLRAYLSQSESEPADVEDIMQESYRRIIELKRSREIRSPKSLLFTIAKNVSNDRLRKKYRDNAISVGEFDHISDLESGEDALEKIEKEDKVAVLEAALNSLPKRCRAVMILRTYENLSYKQIADRLGISVATVETQLARGLKKCKKYFKKQGYTF
ncbi:MAG: RNA polymerase sigma factor [Verrucomicrobiota bacterium]